MKTASTIKKCGGGLWIGFPDSVVNAWGLSEGDTVNLTVRDDSLVIEKSTTALKAHPGNSNCNTEKGNI